MTRYTVSRELLPGGWLWQVVDTQSGWRSIPTSLASAQRSADWLNAS